jgi:titin
LATTVTGSPPATNTTVSGLANGTSYTFVVTATNSIGAGPASTPSNSVTPTAPTAPSAPTGVTATAGDGTATVNWTAPSNSGSPITSYTVTPYVNGNPQTGLAATVTGSPPAITTPVPGLTNGTSYTFVVTATNSIGTGPGSTPSNAVTPSGPTAPAAPTGVSATAGDGTATVNWTAPSNGGSAITSYTVTPYVNGSPQNGLAKTVTGTPPATTTPVPGLTNGTSYTFVVTATNSIGTGPGSTPSNAVTPSAPTAPSAPTGVTATPGNGNATVSWTAPSSNGGSAITSYTVTPYVNGNPQSVLAATVTGSPPATSTLVSGLTNGTTYTFVVTASNVIGTGPASTPSNAVTPTVSAPAFVQQISSHKTNVTSVAVAPASNVALGNRLVVLVGVWSSGAATAKSVTDSAGNTYTEVQHFKASESTELSVWTTPITAGGGTKPTITVTPTAKADVGVAAVEYSGLSTAAGTAAIDQSAQNTGTTSAAGNVSSTATPATTSAGELAVGFYVDSGFNDTVTAGSGWTQRVNVSKASDMEMLVEDQLPAQAATPSASAGTGASTTWLMSALVFKHG